MLRQRERHTAKTHPGGTAQARVALVLLLRRREELGDGAGVLADAVLDVAEEEAKSEHA